MGETAQNLETEEEKTGSHEDVAQDGFNLCVAEDDPELPSSTC